LFGGVCFGSCCFLFFFFCFLMGSVSSSFSLPPAVLASLRSAGSVGLCGSRSLVPPAPLWSLVVASVPASASVACGCVGGLCGLARSAFPLASVFSASGFGSGRSSFARAPVAWVVSLAPGPPPFWFFFLPFACLAGCVPPSSSSRCFRVLGSGSWASLAFAVGSRVPALLWLPAGVVPPSSWGFQCLGGGWFFLPAPSLF